MAWLGIEVCIVNVEPVFALMRLEIEVVQDAPDAGAADRIAVAVFQQRRHDFIQRPARDRATLVLGERTGDRDDPDARGRDNRTRSPRARSIL